MGNGSASANVLNYLRASYALDYRSLAVYRALVAMVVLLDLALRFPYIATLYSDAGAYPRQLSMGFIHPDRWSILFINGTPEFARTMFLVGMLAAMMMAIGWRTRFATVVLWVVVLSFQARNNHANSAADTLMRVSLFWGMFLPLGAVWSVDANINRHRSAPPWSGGVASVMGFALLLQGACVYFFAAMLKDGVPWRENMDAVYYALGVADLSNPIGNWLFHNAPGWIFEVLTLGTLWLEFAILVMILVPIRSGWLRTVGVLLVVALHIGIASTMWVGLFPAISIASISVALPSSFWGFISGRVRLPKASRLRRFASSSDGNLVGPNPVVAESLLSRKPSPEDRYALRFNHSHLFDKTALSRKALNTFAVLSIVLMLSWNVSTVSSYQPSKPLERLTLATGIFQQWSMFAPTPQAGTLWYVVEGELASGEKVDLMTPIVANDVFIRQPVVWDQSEGHVMTDKYWRKYFEGIAGRESDQFAFADYTCRTWNAANNDEERLISLVITQGLATTLPNSERADPVYTTVGLWHCG